MAFLLSLHLVFPCVLEREKSIFITSNTFLFFKIIPEPPGMKWIGKRRPDGSRPDGSRPDGSRRPFLGGPLCRSIPSKCIDFFFHFIVSRIKKIERSSDPVDDIVHTASQWHVIKSLWIFFFLQLILTLFTMTSFERHVAKTLGTSLLL